MRVYEFSKQCGIPTKELLESLEKGGFSINSHMAVLTPDAIEFLTKKFKLSSQEKSQKESKSQDVVVPKHSEVGINKIVDEKPVKRVQQESKAQKQSVEEPAKQGAQMLAKSEKPAYREQQQKNIEKKNIPFIPMHKAHETPQEPEQPNPIVLDSMSVGVFADQVNRPVSDIILTLLKWGIVAGKNQILTEDIVNRLATYYEVPVVQKTKEHVEEGKGTIEAHPEAEMVTRAPVVVVLGHVDHGKTTLLDFIRKTRVAAREKGGITQHLGAYQASTPQGNIVFIDTPGHEAFSKMRMRGIKVADVVILVVAADDSVMPQTIEAIKQAKSMHVPIIVAVNKIDKVEASRLEVIKRDLANQDLLPEEWGGEIVVVPISAKFGQGVDQLLDMVILQSQMMDLKATIAGSAKGYVLEAKLEKGRGPVATMLFQQGTLHVGDFFVCGKTHGKVSSLVDSHGQRISKVGPSMPVLVAGFSELPNAGDYFEAVPQEEYKKSAKSRVLEHKPSPGVAFIKTEGINIIIKTDTNSSKEAILGAIHKFAKKFEKKFNVVLSGVGPISESDVEFANTTGSIIFGLHVKAESSASVLAQKEEVSIQLFD